MCLDEVKEAVHEYVELAIESIRNHYGKDVRVDNIVLNGRMRRSAGRAGIKTCPRTGHRTYKVEISTCIFKFDSKKLKDTVIHEVCHVADHQLFGNFEHGPTWKELMVAVGQKPDVYYSKEEMQMYGHEVPERRHQRVLAQCVSCSKQYKLTPYKANRLQRYVCRCKNPLKIV